MDRWISSFLRPHSSSRACERPTIGEDRSTQSLSRVRETTVSAERTARVHSSDLVSGRDMAAFKLPPIARSDDAFGPPRDALVESEIREMIYAPYNKTDKFGRCADWMSEDGARGDASSRDARREERRERRERERESKRKDGASGGSGGAVGGVETVFNFVADAGEEESFSLVDNTSSRGGGGCLLYTSPSPRDRTRSRMPSSA